jgi:hypothetical protein
MEMLALIGGDAEGLFHETIRLVAVAVGTAVGVGFLWIRVGGFFETRATFAFHFAVGQETPRDPAGGPGLAIGPAAHSGLALVPYEDGAGFDGLALLFG